MLKISKQQAQTGAVLKNIMRKELALEKKKQKIEEAKMAMQWAKAENDPEMMERAKKKMRKYLESDSEEEEEEEEVTHLTSSNFDTPSNHRGSGGGDGGDAGSSSQPVVPV